jgi:hypothetical protein
MDLNSLSTAQANELIDFYRKKSSDLELINLLTQLDVKDKMLIQNSNNMDARRELEKSYKEKEDKLIKNFTLQIEKLKKELEKNKKINTKNK